MPRTRRLLRKDITYSTAKEEEVNILHQLGYYEQQVQFFAHLNDKRSWMKAIVAYHLGLQSSVACHVAEIKDWLHGSFNVLVPVTIDPWTERQQPGQCVLLRFPLPYRIGEAFRPGNGDKKIQCEAGTYAWLQENCSDVPIPRLYGFATSTGKTVREQCSKFGTLPNRVQFTRLDNLPFLTRCFQSLRYRLLSLLGRPVPSNYVVRGRQTPSDGVVGAGYLLIECIEDTQGTMLSNTWLDKQHDITLRTNFFRELSRILLSISRTPLPRIGSFIIDYNGFLCLTNRPLSIEVQQLENEHIPTYIHSDYTYSTVDSYVIDILGAHDSRFRHQPNAVNNLGDCVHQLSILSAMRTVFPEFFQRELRRGPFVFVLTDLHQSNIFVDAEWHITCLVDLEWACSQPIEMVRPPHWLTNKGVDEIIADEYDEIRMHFMNILAAEERQQLISATSNKINRTAILPHLSDVMNRTWEMGTFWYTLALSSPTGVFRIFHEHIRPMFTSDYSEEFSVVMPFFWGKNVGHIAGLKLSDREEYDIKLRQAFDDGPD